MANTHLSVLLSLFTLASALVAGDAWGQDKRASREREALRRTQQQVQQMRQEKTALEEKLAGFEQEKAVLSQEKEKQADQLRGAEARANSEGAKRRQLQAALEAMTREKQALQAQKDELDRLVTELTAKQANTTQQLTQSQAQHKQVETTLATRDKQVATCEEKNIMLYRHGRDLIDQCTDRSATDAMLRLEPFTGIRRVGIENMLEEYRDKFEAQKLVSPAGN